MSITTDDKELSEWFKSHPEYHPFTQSEGNNEIVMPDHLSQAFICRMKNLFVEKKLKNNLSNLLKIYPDLFY